MRSSATIAVIIFVMLAMPKTVSAFFWKRNSFCNGLYTTAAWAVSWGREVILGASLETGSVAFNKVAYEDVSFTGERGGPRGTTKSNTPPISAQQMTTYRNTGLMKLL